MKNRDKILDYFDNVADGTIVSANDMYEHGFERMNQEAFFRAVERLSDEGEIIRVGRGMYIKKSDAQGDITELILSDLTFVSEYLLYRCIPVNIPLELSSPKK